MIEVLKKWYQRYFSEEESVLLLVLLAGSLITLMTVGDVLAPVFVAVVLAYLMQGLARRFTLWGLPPKIGVWLSMLLLISGFFAFSFGLLPLVWRQLVGFARDAPAMVEKGRVALSVLLKDYPSLMGQEQFNQVMGNIQVELAQFGHLIVTKGLSNIPSMLAVLVYIVLTPLMVFFLLKDREKIVSWSLSFLPAERPLLNSIWHEIDRNFANYTRGKVIEIIVVGSVTYLCFSILGLNYAALLSLLVGLSAMIPYIGVALVSIPVVMVAYFQWGLEPDFYGLLLAYTVIQVMDGNVLVPLLFSGIVNLHPVAIIIAVLFFGGIWGGWGFFFAIPLATLVNAIICAWPTKGNVVYPYRCGEE